MKEQLRYMPRDTQYIHTEASTDGETDTIARERNRTTNKNTIRTVPMGQGKDGETIANMYINYVHIPDTNAMKHSRQQSSRPSNCTGT